MAAATRHQVDLDQLHQQTVHRGVEVSQITPSAPGQLGPKGAKRFSARLRAVTGSDLTAMPALTRKQINEQPERWQIHYAPVVNRLRDVLLT